MPMCIRSAGSVPDAAHESSPPDVTAEVPGSHHRLDVGAFSIYGCGDLVVICEVISWQAPQLLQAWILF